jgi:amino acid adenylation domain-containing protein
MSVSVSRGSTVSKSIVNEQEPEAQSSVVEFSEAKRRLLQKYVSGYAGKAAQWPSWLKPRPAGAAAPLSFSQEQVWLHAQMAGDVPFYNETMTVYRRGPLDPTVLEQSLSEIVRRHEIWRTTFTDISGEPAQVVHPIPELPFHAVDLRDLSQAERDSGAIRLATVDARQSLDLKSGPLLRALLVRLDEEEYRLYITVHQMIFDAVSAYRVFLPELVALYEAFSTKTPSPLPDLGVQYADFASGQRTMLKPGLFSEHLDYWQEQLAGDLPVLQWPNQHPRPPLETHRGAIQQYLFPADLVGMLKELSRQEGVSSYMTLLAGLATLLHRYTGQDDILLGAFTAGRKLAEVETLLGYFVNPLALRIDLSGSPTFAELLSRVRGVVLDALAHEDLPFVHVVQQAQPRPDPSRNPLFQIALSQQPKLANISTGWDLKTEEISNGGSKLDLVIVVDEREESIFGPITYNPDLFDAAAITSLVEHWQTLLASAADNPSQRIADVPILTQAQREQILFEWNSTGVDDPSDACLHERIEEQVAMTPEGIAIMCGGDSLTYRELNGRANQLAHWLRRLGVVTETLVGICVERSIDMVVALLGVLKAGGAYVPLDPGFPKGRLAFMAEDSRLGFLITDHSLDITLATSDGKLVYLPLDWPAISCESQENLGVEVGPENLVYVIYTSGSTGKPKGVQISHRAITNLLTSMQLQPGLSRQDALLAVTTISFDIAALELYLPLMVGGRCVIASREASSDAQQLWRMLKDNEITVMQATPSTWKMLVQAGWPGKRNLKILSGGESLPRDLAGQLLPRASSLWNLYGPTETTVWSAAHQVLSAMGPILIGRPIANTQMYILDAALQPVPPGVTGDLYIGGEGLARGYLNRPKLDAEKFINNPFVPAANSRLYKTGDVARYQSDGCIECLGRIDDQVKLRGFRIELGEIESVLCEHPAVHDACAIVREDAPGDQRLVAYVVADPDASPGFDEVLRNLLKEKLPGYMMPTLVLLNRLPLTPNGKLDRNALPAPGDSGIGRQQQVEDSLDPVEQLLAGIWADVLRVPEVSACDNFFDLGGHSVLAAQVVARLEKELGLRMKPKELAFQTLRQFASGCRERMQIR